MREARAEDLPALVRLCDQLGYPSSSQAVEERLRAMLLQKDNNALLVALDEAADVVGFVHVGIRPMLVADRTAEICGLVVDDVVRGKGHGKRLMAAAESWAKERECVEVSLRSNIKRAEAHEFYKSLGYDIYKTSYAFKKKM